MKRRRPIRLRQDLRDQVRTLLLLQDHHLKLAQQHEAQLRSLLQLAHGIDLATENWTLDEARGVLTPTQE